MILKMEMSNIIKEIRIIRETNATKCDYDLDKIYKDIKMGENKLKNAGWLINQKVKNKR